MQPSRGCRCTCELSVSILIRPEGRMQPSGLTARLTSCPSCFNPHPARRPDATGSTQRRQTSTSRASFNPHPARRPDATPRHGDDLHRGAVSILIRPEGRMQQAGETRHLMTTKFQSSSGQKAGCNTGGGGHPRHPIRVSILIRPEGRMQLEVGPFLGLAERGVSILIRPEGRMQPESPRFGRQPR